MNNPKEQKNENKYNDTLTTDDRRLGWHDMPGYSNGVHN